MKIKIKRWIKDYRIKIIIWLLDKHTEEIEEYQAKWLTVHINDKKAMKEVINILKRRLLY